MRSASSQPRDDAADLRDAAEVLGELAAPDRRFDRLARLAGALLDAPAAGISVVASGRVVHLGLHAPDGAPEVEASFLGRCAADGLHDDVDARGDADLAWRLGVPLPGAGRALGVVWIAAPSPRPLGALDHRHLADVAAAAADLVALLGRAEPDRLTRLDSRTALLDALGEHWREAAHDHRSLSVLMVELDDLDRFVAQFGELIGDHLTTEVAELIVGAVADPDARVAHWDRARFAVLLPDADAATAGSIAARVVSSVTAAAIPFPAGRDGLASVSIGASTSKPLVDGGAPRLLVGAADQALYAARRRGRGRWEHAGGSRTNH